MKLKNILLPGLTLFAASTITALAQTDINGAGSTFDYPAFTKWSKVYQDAHPGVTLNYQSIGSGGGIKALLSETVDFGASDGPMSDAQMKTSQDGPILHIPVLAGAEAIVYNLDNNPKLKFDSEVIAGIYLGQITKWDDPKIKALNPGVGLPDDDIAVIHRSDGSGTTYIFTDYLSVVSKAWADVAGKGTSVKWPVGLGGKGNEGVAGQIRQLPDSIGYVELAYAVENKMTYASIKNKDGQFVDPSLEGASSALATATIPDDFRFSIVNAPGAKTYPIAGASWVLIYQNQKDTAKGKALVDFLKWAVTDGQKLSAELVYAPLPDALQQRILKKLDTIK